jgi:mono/diheme cytochrome c family protein
MKGVLAALAVTSSAFLMAHLHPVVAQDAALPPPASRPVDFARDIEPIFREQCYSCHGPDQQMSGLRLDQTDDALRGGYSGSVIVAGDSANSRLISLVSGRDKVVMPMGGDRLSAEQVGLLRAWIDQGAKRPASVTSPTSQTAQSPAAAPAEAGSSHWAFRPISRPATPPVRNAAWVRNPIDAFVLARLEAEGLRPAAEADRTTLIRRVSLDLIGLPPTPQEVAAFVSDNQPDAYERVVDRLLRSPHYGEKWGRHWLDLARYADSDGYRRDEFRPNAWRYRHWVIEALNRDMPFDQFTIEQIAGDLLPGATTEQKVATGFHRNTLANRESGIDNEQTRVEQVVDRTNAVGTVWLGLTVGCAQCHDHKYDPLKQKEYYQLFAFFNNAEEVDIDAPLPGELGPYANAVAAYQQKRQELLQQYRVPELMQAWEKGLLEAAANPGQRLDWDNALTELKSSEAQPVYNQGEKILRTDPGKRTDKQQKLLLNHFITNYRRVITAEENKQLKFNELRKDLDTLEAGFPALSEAQTITVEAEPRDSYIHLRGDFRARGIKVQPGTPAFLHGMPADPAPTRLTLARWIVSRENPLTARVTVNRLWQELLGRGISATPENFGLQGEKPTHPELLDWLASNLVESGGWSLKYAIKRIVMSATYRQSSTAPPALMTRDPENRLLARQRRFRLPAELIRDSALAVSGLLYPAIGGRSVRPPLPDPAAVKVFASTWRESTGPDRYRRGLYIQYQRISPYPMLANFDMPSSYAPLCRRDQSISPLQALNLLNDPVFFEAAQAFAFRVLTEVPSRTFADRLDYAFRLALVRAPDADERELLTAAFERQKDIIQKSGGASYAAPAAEAAGLDRVEASAWVGLSSILLNLDEFITRD